MKNINSKTFKLITIAIIFCKTSASEDKNCTSVPEKDAFDCHPEFYASKVACEQRGCCWREYPDSHGQPFCFFPSSQQSYKVTHWSETDFGYVANLTKVSASHWPRDVINVTLKIWFETQTRIRIKFSDSDTSRWEVPIETPAPPSTKPSNVDYQVQYNTSPFGLRVSRKSNGAVLFDSIIPNSPFTFSDQFLQITTHLSSPLLYGIGERYGDLLINATSSFHRFSLWNRDQWPSVGINLYGSHPFFINPEIQDKTMSHGIFMLNSNALEIEVQPGPYATLRSTGGVIDLYIFTGPSHQEVVQQYVHTIGLPSLPPLWSLGFHLCRWKYQGTEGLARVVERNRQLGIPYDVQWSDIDYMEDAKIWTLDQSNYRNLPDLVNDLHQAGQRYVIIVDPAVALRFDNTYPTYDRGLQMGVFVRDAGGEVLEGKVWPGATVFPDFSHPNTSEWWFHDANQFHHILPYDGLWIDMNEPSSFITGSSKGCTNSSLDQPPYTPRVSGENLAAMTLCPSAQHHLSSHFNLHNLYGLQEAMVTHGVLSRIRPNKRSFILSRSTYPSHGKYAQHWTGDVCSTWKDLQYSIPSILSFQFFGVPMVGADICGFNGDTNEELCVRWMQVGAFYPFMRNHNDDKSRDQDPAVWSEEGRQAMKKVTQVRYSLLPFFYTQFFHNHITAKPVVKPLFFVYPGDDETYGIESQFMWGDCLLISPALHEGQREVRAYFPKDDWFDLFTSHPITSQGQYFNLTTPLDAINIHIRAGCVIAWQEAANNTVTQRGNPFKLTVALDRNNSACGDLFWDDGESLDSIEKQHYSLVEFKSQSSSLHNVIKQSGYRPQAELRLSEVFVLGLRNRPSHVTFNRLSVNFEYDSLTKQLTVPSLNQSLVESFVVEWL